MTPLERAKQIVTGKGEYILTLRADYAEEAIADLIREAIEADRAARQCPDADVAAIRERCELATPEPWEARDTIYGGAADIVAGSSHVASVHHIDPATPAAEHRQAQARLNANFIAHARQDIPDLLSLVDFYAGLLSDLQQDSDAYQRGLEIGRREERARAVRWARHHETHMRSESVVCRATIDGIGEAFCRGGASIADRLADDIAQEGDPS